MDAMPKTVATPELRFPVDAARKFAVVEEVLARLSADGAKVDATDGARVNTDDGWWLLRASNTQDVLVARAEAQTKPGLRPPRRADRRSAGEVRRDSDGSGALRFRADPPAAPSNRDSTDVNSICAP